MAEATDGRDGRAQVYYAPGDIRYEPAAVGEVEAGDVLVRVEACAICGTDIKSFRKGNPRIQAPMTMGHEFCGRIVELGAGVSGWDVGQRVTMATTIGCGQCVYCRRGRTNLCRSAEAMGFHYPGAMAPQMRAPAKAVRQGHLVDVGDLDACVAALAEPLSCAINDYSHVPMDTVESILIVGLGPLGMLHALAAMTMGVANVCGVELPGRRAEMAAQLGLRAVCTPEDIPDRCGELSGGEGFGLVVVTAPHNPAQAGAIDFARKGGYVALFGSLPVGEEFLSLNSRTIHYNELVVYGTSDSTCAHVGRAVELLHADPASFARLITHRLPLADLGAAMDEIAAGNAVKVVLVPEHPEE